MLVYQTYSLYTIVNLLYLPYLPLHLIMSSYKVENDCPIFDPDNLQKYEIQMDAYLRGKKRSNTALTDSKPVLDVAMLESLKADGADTEASIKFQDKFKGRFLLWRKRNDVAYAALVRSCNSNAAATNLIMLNPKATAKELFKKLKDKFDLSSVTSVV